MKSRRLTGGEEFALFHINIYIFISIKMTCPLFLCVAAMFFSDKISRYRQLQMHEMDLILS